MRAWLVATGIFLISALYILAALRLPVGIYNDDAANVLLARSLRHGAYSFPGGLGAPEEYMPAFPLLLVVPALIVEPHWNFLRAIGLAFAALCLFLTWRLARRFLSKEAAAAVVLLTAINPVLVGLGGLVTPSLAYLALTLALIDGVGAAESRRNFLWLAAGAGIAPLLRPQGAVLVGCLALAQWHRRGLKRGLEFLSLALLPALAWTARNHLRAGSSRDYVDTWRQQIAALGETSILERAAGFLSPIFGNAFLQVPGTAFVQGVFGTGVIALALTGAFFLLKKREDARVFVLSSYVAGLLVLHMTWKWIDPRYLIPFVPLLWILIVAAATKLLRERRALLGALLAVFVAFPLPFDLSRARLGLHGSVEFQPETMAWIRGNVPASARLASMNNYSVALYTGRECLAQLAVRHAGQWVAQSRLDRVDYLHVVLPRPDDEFNVAEFPAGYQPAFARWLDARPEATQLYHNLDEGALVYRMNRP
jgi:hypothetical protein